MATSCSAQRCDLSYSTSDVLSDLPFQLVPHFLLFLDGVYQLMTHYPLSFEYAEVSETVTGGFDVAGQADAAS
jgi:hypothetical protein